MGFKLADLNKFDILGLHPTTKRMVQLWFRQCGMKIENFSFKTEGRYLKYANFSPAILKQFFATRLIFICKK